jgi:hypothetical protein
MKLKPLGLFVASVVLTSGLYGCATRTTREGIMEVVHGRDPNNQCTWHFNNDPNGKVSGPIVVDTGNCSVDPPSRALFIGSSASRVMPVKKIGGVEFILEGSCRYCYTNTDGGMSCVTYPGPPC